MFYGGLMKEECKKTIEVAHVLRYTMEGCQQHMCNLNNRLREQNVNT